MRARLGVAERIVAITACIGGTYWPVKVSSAAEGREIIVSVPGIPGPYCAYGVEKRLLERDGIQRVELLWKEEKIRIVIAEGKTVTRDQIMAAVEEADYPYEYEIETP